MFTGIIKEVGRVKRVEKKANLWKLCIFSRVIFSESNISDSISVNGVCLTLTEKKNSLLFFEVIKTTLENTNLKRLKINSLVNLEPSLRLQDKIGGHFVLGHIDCEGRIRNIRRGKNYVFEIEYPKEFRKYIIEKGSIAVEGISLTIQKKLSSSFAVDIIPFTFQHTNLKEKRIGDWLNIEFDYLLKARLGG
ncbi:MAG: hypothetical protein B6D56_02520 [Candidatus Omnitrophica bacterium 4484_70.1]|nr:MAG: hypothetical protein B6D56_02520 [Candidatus Omnitrophica bacterium 4484_70.1]